MERKKILVLIKSIVLKYNIRKSYLFGSFARGERYNDLDIMIDPPPHFSLLDLVGLANEIEEKTGKKVDVITRRSINKRLKKYIMKDMVAI